MRSVLAAVFVLAALPACQRTPPQMPASEAKEPFGRLSVDEVQKLVDEHRATVFDVNSAERYQKSHLPGAVHVDFDGVTAQNLPADKDRTLIFYCANEH